MPRLIECLVRPVLGIYVAIGIAMPVAAAGSGGSPLRLVQAGQQSGAKTSGAKPAQPSNDIERQVAELRRQLNITAAQQAQFDALAQAMRQNAQEMEGLAREAQQQGKPNAVEAVRTGNRFAEAEAAGLKRLLPPLQTLYDTLSEQQKKSADQIFASGPEPGQPQGKGH